MHGLFEDPRVLQALYGAATPTLDSVFDGLADYIDRHFEPGVLQSADCSALKVLIGWKRRKQRRKWRFDKACLRRQADEHICWMPEARFKVHA